MQIDSSSGPVQMQVAISVQTKAQDTSAQLVGDLMAKSLAGSSMQNQARASQGIGTNLNITG